MGEINFYISSTRPILKKMSKYRNILIFRESMSISNYTSSKTTQLLLKTFFSIFRNINIYTD